MKEMYIVRHFFKQKSGRVDEKIVAMFHNTADGQKFVKDQRKLMDSNQKYLLEECEVEYQLKGVPKFFMSSEGAEF